MMPMKTKARNGPGSPLYFRIFRTRLGWCAVGGGSAGIAAVILPMKTRTRAEKCLRQIWGSAIRKDKSLLALAERHIQQYFAGQRKSFDLPISLAGRRPFERAVYAATRRIPYGRTATYAAIARKVGNPRAARAVGRAMARNPVPLLIPCHRVLGSDGGLCGFTSEGGLQLKQKLLALEKAGRRR